MKAFLLFLLIQNALCDPRCDMEYGMTWKECQILICCSERGGCATKYLKCRDYGYGRRAAEQTNIALDDSKLLKVIRQAEETAAGKINMEDQGPRTKDSPKTYAQAYYIPQWQRWILKKRFINNGVVHGAGVYNSGSVSASGNIGIRRSKAVRQAEETAAEKAVDPKNQSDLPRTVAQAYWPYWSKEVRQAEETAAEKTKAVDPKNQSDSP